MRTRLFTLAATLGLAGFAVASSASTVTPAVRSISPAATGFSGGSSRGGSAHGWSGSHGGGGHRGGGGHAYGDHGYSGHGHGDYSHGSAGHGSYARGNDEHGNYGSRSGHAGRESYISHSVYDAHRGYGIVGYESADLSRDRAAPRGVHGARRMLALGPRTRSAATAARVTDRLRRRPGTHRPRPKRPQVRQVATFQNANCGRSTNADCGTRPLEFLGPFCPLTADENVVISGNPLLFGCPSAIKAKVLPDHRG